ncbi:MAG TPA: glycosyltransferase 87 family protein, partial [Ktedonobacteraceae bacterium]|nr:glycosyltransferase 87 family protein [Ktedonobacteraceae bacterium]
MQYVDASPPLVAKPQLEGPSRSHKLNGLVNALEWLILLGAVAYFAGRGVPRAWQHLNTDFQNYYVTARLLAEDYSTTRAYEWIWLQRQKDHMGIQASDQPVVGFVPHTPFSALLMWPLTHWPPLTAKRIWIVFNLLLLLAVAPLLRSLTRLPWKRIALLMGLNYPLLRNLEYGQYYLLLLFLVTL